LDIVCVVYLDDILIFSRTQKEHDQHCRMVFDRLRQGRLFANIEKCEFDRSNVEHLGYIIGADGIKMNPKKLSTIINWPLPRSVKEVQSFLGFANFYQRFIKDYARIAHPLHSITKKSVPNSFTLPSNAIQAFESLKSAFTSAPVLLHFNPNSPSWLVTDTSDFAISGILLQPDEKSILHPVTFFSHKLSPAEINYKIYDKELPAIVETFRDMRTWLIGTETPVSVSCDHKTLEYFMSTRILNRRQARWSMFLSEFNFRLDYLPGSKNPADPPSRRPDFVPQEGDDILKLQNKTLLTPTHTERIFKSTQSSAAPLISNLSSNSSYSNPLSVSALKTFTFESSELSQCFKDTFKSDTEWREALAQGDDTFSVQDDLVFHNGQLFVPATLREDIVHSRHDAIIAGHPGRARTIELVERDYSWPGLRRFVRRHVESCTTCPLIKAPRHKPYGLLQPLEIPDRPWKGITMDFIVKLPIATQFGLFVTGSLELHTSFPLSKLSQPLISPSSSSTASSNITACPNPSSQTMDQSLSPSSGVS